MKRKQVYLAYTKNETLGWVPQLLAIYSKSSYQQGFNWLANIAKNYDSLPYCSKEGNISAQFVNPINGQIWWLESHEVI